MSRYCGNCKHYSKNGIYGLYCGNAESGSAGEMVTPFDGGGCGTWEGVAALDVYELRWRVLAIIESAELNGYGQGETAKAIDGLNGGLEAIADSLATAITQDKGSIEAIKEEKARLAEREKAAEKRIELAKGNLKRMMEAAGKKSFKTALHDFSIRKNPPGVAIDVPGEIPACYMKTADPVPDKTAIREAIKAGREVPGARLEQTESLRIS